MAKTGNFTEVSQTDFRDYLLGQRDAQLRYTPLKMELGDHEHIYQYVHPETNEVHCFVVIPTVATKLETGEFIEVEVESEKLFYILRDGKS